MEGMNRAPEVYKSLGKTCAVHGGNIHDGYLPCEDADYLIVIVLGDRVVKDVVDEMRERALRPDV